MSVWQAVIADDEPALARDLQQRLRSLWPELQIVAVAGNGEQALAALQQHHPAIAFLDIRMPGLSGLEVAREIDFPCQVVFVTAYDEYAVEAFEREAVDYVLKPVDGARLEKTVERLRRTLTGPVPTPDMAALVSRVQQALEQTPGAARLRWIRASMGERMRILPVEEVVAFQARDKYTSVFTAEGEFLIRTPVRELADQLDPEYFWRVHRATIVNVSRIASVSRDFRGQLSLRLHGHEEAVVVSRRYAGLFERM